MSETRTLVLPDTYEALVKELGSDYERMARFVVPVLEAERQLAIIARSIRRSGRVVLLLGLPGSGKSTFIQSLKWRTHLPISDITEIDAFPFFTHEQSLGPLFGEIQHQANESVKRKRANTVPTLVLNYLENLEGIPSSDIRAFFRNINGLLSTSFWCEMNPGGFSPFEL